MESTLLVQHLANAVSLGSAYGLIALGYAIVYGVLGLINIAHGDLFMLSNFLAAWGVMAWLLPAPLSYAVAAIITVVVGVTVEAVAYKPLRDVPVSQLTSAMAVSLLLQSSVIVFFTGVQQPFPVPTVLRHVFHLGGIAVPLLTVVIIAVCAGLLLVLAYIVTKTRFGRAMRAVSKDLEMTQLMGFDTDRVISYSFALATAYAVAGGFMWGAKFPTVYAYSGVMPGLKAFVAAVVGGIGSIPGALVGGFTLGLIEIMFVAFWPHLSGWRDVLAYVILILFLLLRPGGLFNVNVREQKV